METSCNLYWHLVERNRREGEVAAILGKQATKGVVPCNNGCDDAKGTTSNLKRSAGIELWSCQKDKSNEKEEE